MKGRSFLNTARFLRDNCGDEAAFRSAISRAYYACFLETRKAAFQNCQEPVRKKAHIFKEKDIKHDKLQFYLTNSSDEDVRRLGKDLQHIHGIRNIADYDLSTAISLEKAEDAIELAETVLKDFDKINPKAIGAALDQYFSKLSPS